MIELIWYSITVASIRVVRIITNISELVKREVLHVQSMGNL